MGRSLLATAVALVGLLGASGLWLASSAQATASGNEALPPGCTSWNDGTTFSVSCSDGTYEAQAQCSNGAWLKGDKVEAPARSYVYCSSVGATYVAGTGRAAMYGG